MRRRTLTLPTAVQQQHQHHQQHQQGHPRCFSWTSQTDLSEVTGCHVGACQAHMAYIIIIIIIIMVRGT